MMHRIVNLKSLYYNRTALAQLLFKQLYKVIATILFHTSYEKAILSLDIVLCLAWICGYIFESENKSTYIIKFKKKTSTNIGRQNKNIQV